MTDQTPADHATWIARAAALEFETGLFIDGRSSAGAGPPIAAINPANGALLAELSCGTALDIDRAVAAARLALGGNADPGETGGAYVEPALLCDVTPAMTVEREEIFGPVACVQRFTSEAEAIRLANDSIYGLAASIWTSDVSCAHRMVKSLEAGVVWVNCFGDGDMTQPFGGYKQSGNTRDKSLECLAGYLQSKSAWFSLD